MYLAEKSFTNGVVLEVPPADMQSFPQADVLNITFPLQYSFYRVNFQNLVDGKRGIAPLCPGFVQLMGRLDGLQCHVLAMHEAQGEQGNVEEGPNIAQNIRLQGFVDTQFFAQLFIHDSNCQLTNSLIIEWPQIAA